MLPRFCRPVQFFLFHGENQVGHVGTIGVLHKRAAKLHSISPRHGLRSRIGVTDNGEHFLCAQNVKGVIAAGPGRFGGIAVMPKPPLKEITYLQRLPSAAVIGRSLPLCS